MLAVVPVGALSLGSNLVVTAGSWERGSDIARFTPRFPTAPGTRHAVLGRGSAPGEDWRELTRVDVPEAERLLRTVVEAIDPNNDWIPANLLRFSLTFSAAMEEGSAAGQIRLLDEAGAEVPGTLVGMPPELWDRGRRRLTVLVEPGRIKRGLQPHVQAGAPFRDGSVVTLVVDSRVRDADGAPLSEEARRTYRVGAPVRSRIDPALWDVHWPDARTDPLVVRFDRPLDRVLVQRYLRVTDEHERPMPGRTSLDAEARLWTFTPASSDVVWTLHVDARLEDLAGNSVRRVFDRDLRTPDDDGIEASEVVIRR